MSIGRKLVPLLDVMMLLVGLFLLLIAMARFHPTSSKSSTSNLPKTLKKIVGKLPVVPLYNDGVTTRCWLLGENGYGEGEPIETEEQFQMVFKKLYPNISTDSDEHCVILVFPEYWSSALDEKGKEEILQRYKKKNRSLTFAYRFLDKLERKKE